MKKIFLQILLAGITFGSTAQVSSEELLNFLGNEKVISQEKIDSLRADIALEQQKSPKDKLFTIDLDYRPRTEMRNGYGQLRTDTTRPTVFTTQRARLGFTFKHENKFTFHMSVQDIRMWGDQNPRYNGGTVQIFEAYGEPYINSKLSVRIGRQKLAFDNQRLFAENDWRQNAGTHDAFNLKYNFNKLSSEFAVAWNQNVKDANTLERFNDNYYNGATPYKGLAVSYLKYLLNSAITLSSINSADAFQTTVKGDDKEKLYTRFTNGGRIEYQKKNIYLTFSGYWQSGFLASGKRIEAWYIQPEIKYTKDNNYTLRLGAEVMSGDNGKKPTPALDHNFVALYGVAHRFNGSMDFFTRFPNDLGNAGLINPYFFVIKNIGKKLEIRADFHTFYSQNNYVTKKATEDYAKGATINKYLGFENDLLVTYKPNSYTKIDIGYSYALPTVAMKEVLSSAKGYGRAGLLPTWFYASFSFKPQIFKFKF
ncbi:MAG: alginate export family protein [Cytophagales bacterium]